MLHFLLDEMLRGPLFSAILRHNRLGGLSIDVVRVGDFPALPLRSPDSEILLWAEHEGRILLSLDRDTLAGHLAQHLLAGHSSPGIMMLDPTCSIGQLVSFLEMATHAGNPDDYRDRITYVP